MPIRDTNDAELRTLIFDLEKVIVKFTKEQCPICERMARIFSQFSNSEAYKDVHFLRMDAKENPVSSQEVKLTGTPFFATYYKGVLTQCSLLSDKETLASMLAALQQTSSN